jgi:hypothetical protein
MRTNPPVAMATVTPMSSSQSRSSDIAGVSARAALRQLATKSRRRLVMQRE